MDELADWLATEYDRAFRTACLILRNPADAEEAVQDAFLRVWRFRDAVPAGGGRNAWLYRVVVNASLSRLKSERPWRARSSSDELIERPSTSREPAQLAELSLFGAQVARSLATLPPHLRIPLVLRYYAGLSEPEIATAIQRRQGTVKSRLHQAKQRLAAHPALVEWATVEEVAR
jgi:RNA polymerase sigma-70 factor, ECF subfamily